MNKNSYEPLVKNNLEMNHSLAKFRRNIRADVNNFSYWFPSIEDFLIFSDTFIENDIQSEIYLPKSYIIDIPSNVVDHFAMENPNTDHQIILDFVNDTVMPIIKKYFPKQDIFLKNGTFSNKFDFNHSCHIFSTDNSNDIAKKIENLEYASICFDTGGFYELILREYIHPKTNYSIYNGMPLRPEARIFYDFDKHKLLYHVNYWDWDYCHERICDDLNDKKVYEKNYKEITSKLNSLIEKYLPIIENRLKYCTTLRDKWSIDFLFEDDKCYLIDMALAKQSAYWKEEENQETKN